MPIFGSKVYILSQRGLLADSWSICKKRRGNFGPVFLCRKRWPNIPRLYARRLVDLLRL